MKALSLVLCCLCCAAPLVLASGKADSSGAPVDTTTAATVLQAESKVVSVYVVGSASPTDAKKREAEKIWAEDVAVPQSAAAWMPTAFTVSGKDSHFSFDTNLSYRVVKREELAGGILLYSVELPSWTAAPQGVKRYTLSFPRAAVGASQPLPFAMALACMKSGLSQGHALVEDFSWDAGAKQFRAVVVVGN